MLAIDVFFRFFRKYIEPTVLLHVAISVYFFARDLYKGVLILRRRKDYFRSFFGTKLAMRRILFQLAVTDRCPLVPLKINLVS